MGEGLKVGWVWLLTWTAISRFPPEPEAEVAVWWRWVSTDYVMSIICLVWAAWLLVGIIRKHVVWILEVPLPLSDRRRWGPIVMVVPAAGAGVTLIGFLPGHASVVMILFILREWFRRQAQNRALVKQGWGKKRNREA